jgi:DNA-binding transcriptional LysR family regulator
MQLDPAALRVVEAVARFGSLTRAGGALGLSQPAISYQLRRAEDYLGVALFTRGRGGCLPTPAEVKRLARAPALRILTDFGFAGLWLMPRLARFRSLHPGIEVQITASQENRAPQAGEVAIRFARVEDLAEGAWLLMPERVVPVCAPGFLEAQRAPDTPAQLAQAVLLHLDAPPEARWFTWAGWFSGHGIARPRRSGELGMNTYDFVVQAALAGQGVALGWLPLIAPHLASGALVPLGPEILRAESGYWVETRGAATAAQAALADWLRSEARHAS